MAIYQDDKLVKRAFKRVNYNSQQIDELRQCMDPNTGPEYFMRNFMYIQHPTKGRELFKPFDYQVELIRVYNEYNRSISMLSRQTGKCVTGDTYIRIRNKKSGKIEEITMDEFENTVKNVGIN